MVTRNVCNPTRRGSVPVYAAVFPHQYRSPAKSLFHVSFPSFPLKIPSSATLGILPVVRSIGFYSKGCIAGAIVQRFGFSGTPGDTLRAFFTSRSAGMRGTRNVGGIADPVIDALVESVIAANSRMDLLTACKALDRIIRRAVIGYRTGIKPRIGSHTGIHSVGCQHNRDTPWLSRKPGGQTLQVRS